LNADLKIHSHRITNTKKRIRKFQTQCAMALKKSFYNVVVCVDSI